MLRMSCCTVYVLVCVLNYSAIYYTNWSPRPGSCDTCLRRPVVATGYVAKGLIIYLLFIFIVAK